MIIKCNTKLNSIMNAKSRVIIMQKTNQALAFLTLWDFGLTLIIARNTASIPGPSKHLACIALMVIWAYIKFPTAQCNAGVKVSRNAIPGTGNLSLKRADCKIIGFHSRNLCSWAKQVSNLCYSNLIVNESFKFHINHKFTMLNAFTKLKKPKIMLNTFSRSLIIW